MAKKQSAREEHHSAGLIAALKFVAVAQNNTGVPWTRHAILYDGVAYASNGVLSAGHPILEQIQIAPHTAKLIAALERCSEHMALIELPSGLSVKSERFRAIVPCHVLRDMPPIIPDPPIAPLLDGPLRAALSAVAPLATDGAPRVILACVCLRAGSALATNSHVAIEAWHGIDLPEMLVPKATVKAIESIKKELTGFGYSGTSATFHFKDGSWLKSQLYADTYPNMAKFFDVKANPWPVPPGFFDALRTLQPFTDDQHKIFFSPKRLHTAAADTEGASVDIDGIPGGRLFNINYLLMMEGIAKKLDFGTGEDTLKFFGDNVRGVMMGMHDNRNDPPKPAPPPRPIEPSSTALNDWEDDIPF